MKNIFTTQISFLAAFLFFATTLVAQDVSVWPGDVNDNGRVNGIDMMLWAHAFDSTGAKRPDGSGEWVGQPIAEFWKDTFPDGRDMVYADIDGSGHVNLRDIKPLFKNFHRTRVPAPLDTDPWEIPDTSGNPTARLRLLPAGIQLTPEGSRLLIDVELTGIDTAFLGFHGLTFSAGVTANQLKNHVAGGLEQSDNIIGLFSSFAGNRLASHVEVDSTTNTLRFTITDLGRNRRNVDGVLKRLSLPLSDASARSVAFAVDSLVLYDKAMTTHRVAVAAASMEEADCAFTVNPVCGTDGVTYLNPCFAEAAGITFYTAGACWSPGLTVAGMDQFPDCPSYYEPVCGFNGVTYGNACMAEAAGVTDYFSGVCTMGDLSCYDPSLIVVSSGTSLNQVTGVISLTCTGNAGPVCGCDGQQYASACLAEASGVRSYTTGGCDDDCIDPTQITNTDDCGTAQSFVCGCNGETYINECYADAAGVRNYTAGPCNGTSSWCDEAIVIECGDYLPNETTIGAGNQLTSYPGATGVPMVGPDRVYVFEKTSAGDLQVGLEIMTPGLNMDLFLLTGDCGNYTVVGKSTTSNTSTNNEGIVLNDAPNGTYYIVVDQAAAGVGGDYRLELSCGYLDCSQSVPLGCGVTFNGTNAGGADDVSTYTCGSQLNVENNGPEIVHSFTTTEAGRVTIDLTGLDANLELFLLSECSRRSGLQYSQNPGSANERIVRNLPAGTYYVVVDGYNGAISDYSLTVDCASSCNLSVDILSRTGTACGQTGGGITLRVAGGSPNFTAHYVGPVCRQAISTNGLFNFTHLPPGVYHTTVEDASGCRITFPFTISAGAGSLTGHFTPTDAGCGEEGRIDVRLNGSGTAPYTVYLSGDLTRTFTTNSSNFVITPLAAGHYTVSVVDAGGCGIADNVTIADTPGNLTVEIRGEAAGCDGSLGEIVVRAPDGTLPYRITLSGPVSGGQTVNGYNFRVRSLLAGQYVFSLTDAFGCTFTQELTITAGELEVDVSATAANCGVPGAARINISTGLAPYTINYDGPVSGTVNTSEAVTVLNDLPAGTYTFSVWSADGCDQSETIFVEDNGGDLDLTVTQTAAACDGNDSEVQLVINGGNPNYTVNYTGPVTGTTTIGGTGVGLLDLPPGAYTITVSDFGGCSTTREITINGGLSVGSQSSFLYGSGCGQLNNIRTFMGGGEFPLSVVFTSVGCPEQNRTFSSFDNIFDVEGLPNCTYTISVTDANGCTSAQTLAVNVEPNADFLVLTALDGACGGSGAIDVEITAGEHPYFVSWTGPSEGTTNIVGSEFRVRDLPAGTYVFNLTNRDGCEATQAITLLNDGTLDVVSSVVPNDCGAPDQIWNDIEGGFGPYGVEVTRLCDGVEVDVEMSGGAGFEILDLIPCDYKISVTDANGCMTMRTVTVEPYQLFNPIVTDARCGQDGSIMVMVMNEAATGPYTVVFTGPVGGNRSSSTGQIELTGLPGGNYAITVTDANGCTETELASIDDIMTDLELQTALIANDCGQYNQLWNDINGGVAPYTVTVTRKCDNTVDDSFIVTGTGFELSDLDECCYEIEITDAEGCTVITESCVEDEDPDLFTPTPVPGPCGQAGRIDLSFTRGQSPYQVTYTGPQSGDNAVNGNTLSVNDAPPGNYTFVVTDANGCTETETVTLGATTNDLVLSAALIFNDCGQYNQVWIDIFNGTGPFSVEVIRLCDNTTMTEFISGDVGFELTDLEPCDYRIVVTDAAGCMKSDVITVEPAPVNLFDLVTASGECNDLSFFDLDITGGRAPYTIVYDGPVSDSIVTENTRLTRDDLPSGDYIFFVSDSIGCRETAQFSIRNTTTDLELVTSLIFNDCGQLNQLWNDINGGIGPFDVVVKRMCDNAVDTTFRTALREFELIGRDRCDYEITVTDATGCTDMEMTPIGSTTANLFDVTVNNSCDSSGFHLDFIAGTGPYTIVVAGPMTAVIRDVTEPLYVAAPPGDYSVRTLSAEGCSEMNFTSIEGGGEGELAEISFTATHNDLTIGFTNGSSPGDYAWDFGDGSAASTAENPTHTYGAAGSYVVCLSVTNACGANQACQTVEVVATTTAQIVIGGTRSFAGNSVRIPVSLQGVTNVATIAGTFTLADQGLATITHVSAGAIEPQFNTADNSFSFVASGNDGVDLPDASVNVLFFLHLQLGADLGTSDIDMIAQPLELELSSVTDGVPLLVPVSYLSGFVEIAENLLGHISSRAVDMDGEAVAATIFQLSEPDQTYVVDLPGTADGGASTLSALNVGSMYYVEPVKTTDYRNGLSSFEIFLAQRYLLGYDVPQVTNPMQVVAMDMNCSQNLSTLDLFLMQRLLIGDNLNEIPGCNSWTFVPDSHVFPTDWRETSVFPAPRRAEIMLANDTMVMFNAVKTGDVLMSADPGRTYREMPFAVALPETFVDGRTYTLQVTTAEATDLVAFQGQLTLGDGLELVAATTPELHDAKLVTGRSNLRLSWFSTSGDSWALNAGAKVVDITVRATRNLVADADLITFTDGRTMAAEAHDADHLRYRPVVQTTIGTTGVTAFRLHGAAPNPAVDYFDVRFDLPRREQVELQLFDALGRKVIGRSQLMEAGTQRFQLDTRALPDGAYHYQLRAGGDVGTGKVVVRR